MSSSLHPTASSCGRGAARGPATGSFTHPRASRSGRTGQAWTRRGQVNIKNARHADDPRPLDEACACPACTGYSRAYLHHVFRAGEMISGMLLTWHNLHYYQEIMQGMRDAIAGGTLDAWVATFHAQRAEGDIPPL